MKMFHFVLFLQYSNKRKLPNSGNVYLLPLKKGKIIAVAIVVIAILGLLLFKIYNF